MGISCHFCPGVYAPSHRIADKCSLGRAQSIRQHLLAQGVAATQQHPAMNSRAQQGHDLPKVCEVKCEDRIQIQVFFWRKLMFLWNFCKSCCSYPVVQNAPSAKRA